MPEHDRFDRLLGAMVKGEAPSALKKPQPESDQKKPVEKPE
jgi:hypothetical protein